MSFRGSSGYLGLLAVGSLAWACSESFTTNGVTTTGTGASSNGGGGAGAFGGGGSGGSCPDADSDGVTTCTGDCDDGDAARFPQNPEVCGDAKDNDCNATVDDTCGGLGTFVSNAGDDADPGTQALPVRTIAVGIQHAQTIGNGVAVYVAAGHYPENVVVVEGISLYGGHHPTTWVRDPAVNDTAILCQGGQGVRVGNTVTNVTVVDGFRMQGLDNVTVGNVPVGAALTIDGGTPTIRGNVINGPVEGPGARSVGVLILAPSNSTSGVLLRNNRITAGSALQAAPCEDSIGVALDTAIWPPPAPGAAVDATGNVIKSGLCKSSHGVLSYAHADGARFYDNDIVTGSATNGEGFGMAVGGTPAGGQMLIERNRINVDQPNVGTCSLAASVLPEWCGGIDSQAAKLRIINNVVYGVKGTRSTAVWLRNPEQAPQSLALHSNYLHGGGNSNLNGISSAVVLTIFAGQATTVGRIRDNILVGGFGASQFGVFEDSPATKTCKPEALENNDFFAPAAAPLYRAWDGGLATIYSQIAQVNGLTGSAANFQADPALDATLHLLSGSPCIDAGSSVEAPGYDFDGQQRFNGSGYDVGPDEF